MTDIIPETVHPTVETPTPVTPPAVDAEPEPEPLPVIVEAHPTPVAELTAATDVDEEIPDEPVPVPEEEEEAPETPALAESGPESPAEEPPAEPSKKRWYIVKVQSNREDSIKEAIERKVRIEGLEEYFGQIIIPVERIQELRRGRRVTKSIKLYPGYLMVEVEFNDRILYLFRETSGVGDFVGGSVGKQPTPMSDKEVARMLHQAVEPVREVEDGATGAPVTQEKPRVNTTVRPRFSVGDRLRVIDGNFSNMEGEVVDITEDHVRVIVTILGRPVALDLEFWQVETV